MEEMEEGKLTQVEILERKLAKLDLMMAEVSSKVDSFGSSGSGSECQNHN